MAFPIVCLGTITFFKAVIFSLWAKTKVVVINKQFLKKILLVISRWNSQNVKVNWFPTILMSYTVVLKNLVNNFYVRFTITEF